MRVGAWIPSYTYQGLTYERVHEGVDVFSRKANEYGIDLWTIDHLLDAGGLYGMSWLEPLTVTTWAAACAPDVWVGTGILVLPLRNPVVLAKEIATIDFLTGGRYQFGVGPGWYPPEFTVTGTDVRERGKRTDEILGAIRVLLTNEVASYSGRFYQFEGITIEPRPPRMPNVWVAGGSRIPDEEYHDVPKMAATVLDRIVGADWWISRCSGSQEWVKQDWEIIQSRAAELGSAVPRFAHTNFTYVVDTSDGEKAREIQHRFFREVMGTHRSPDHLETCYLFGSVDEIVARLNDLASAGCEYVVLGPTHDDPKQLDLINELIVPQLD
jgi:alkanesulfonate monooxygenase SsuD/methylene tetrahydromethanopterin reductase-like flavin-dependent oxidoreductase (luciferase family)